MELSPNELEVLQGLLNSAREAFHAGGWLAILPLLPMALVNIYKMPFVQGFIEAKLPMIAWSRMGTIQQTLLSFVLGAAPVFISNVIAHMSIAAALILAGSSGIAAIFGHNILKLPMQTEAASKAMAMVHPSISRPLSIIVPIDQARIAEIRADKK